MLGIALLTVCSARAQTDSEFPEEHTESEIVIMNSVLKTIDSSAIPAQVESVIESLRVQEGSQIKKGTLLAELDDAAIKVQIENLKTQLKIARSKAENEIDLQLAIKAQQVATNEFERAQNTNARVPDTYPLNEIDRLRLVADQATLEIERARHQLRLAVLQVAVAEGEYRKAYDLFERHRIRSPVDGVVVTLEKRVGEWVQPGTSLLSIVRLDKMRVTGFIHIEHGSLDLVGRKVRVKLKGDAVLSEFEGRVSFVNPEVNTIDSRVQVYVEVGNRENLLRPGLPVTAEILGK
ncbi:MAG: efflux RND transporter periplasmic adaptor subunit [Planctomycetota bacterium]